ncbi:hypothetical protein [Streptomyces sp. NPDC005262]|uniref:hypothetical protein n=1 Tax=Streptomyces sp. NPDC005262 TaxID=3364710 RepID=UPI0036BFE86E
MGGRPTEAPGASGTPMPDASWDSRSEAPVSETRVAEISAPAWGLPASGPGRAPVLPGLTGKGRTPVLPGLTGKGWPASVMGHFMRRDGSSDRGEGPHAPETDPATPKAPDAAGGPEADQPPTAEPDPAADLHGAPALDRAPDPHRPLPTGPVHPPKESVARHRRATEEPEGAGAKAAADAAPIARAPEIAHTPAVSARKPSAARRGPIDPVKTLMHRHRELCERAVDPLEIAAGLEAHGVTDRTAARYRHRDVFSLAEELYARVPAVAGEPGRATPAPMRDIETRAAWSLRALLPGAACTATAVVLKLTDGVLGGGGRLTVALIGALVALLGLGLCLRSGPLHAADGRSSAAAGAYGYWLLGYVLYGEALIDQVLSGGPEGPWAITPAPLLGLALAVAPAAWCAHLFSVHAQRKLAGSRALEEFAAGVRPLLFGTVALFLCVLTGLLHLADLGYGGGGDPVAAAAVGVLLLLSRLLTVHGFPEPATTGLAAACAVEAVAPALVLAGRLPGLHFVAQPVYTVVAAAGTGAVPAIACGAAALGLLIHATVALSRASAHTRA